MSFKKSTWVGVFWLEKSPCNIKWIMRDALSYVCLKCHFDKLKYEIKNKVWFSFLYLSWGIKHKTKWFFHFKNNWTLKFKYEFSFSFFMLIWETDNQIYLNKYLQKLVTISPYAVTINKYNRVALMIKR